jgi:hypothetical protein
MQAAIDSGPWPRLLGKKSCRPEAE